MECSDRHREIMNIYGTTMCCVKPFRVSLFLKRKLAHLCCET